MKRRAYWFLATLILLTAAVLRLWQLDDYPPGPHYDEAAEVLITRSIAFGGANHFPIVESYQGREALFYYLSAPLFHLIHDGVFTLQIANVFISLLTTAGTIALGRAMFAGARGRVVGLTAGTLMMWSFPLLLLARQAFRTPVLPLMQTLALLCLWQGLRRGRYSWLIAGGVFGGAALYTYMASRLFPVWLLIGGLLLVALDAGQRRLRLRQGLAFFGALALTAGPMGIYALQNPDIFLGRLYEVTQPGQSVSLFESVGLHLRMFFVQGELLLRYNSPGRPYFTWPEGLLMLAGIAVAGWRLLRAGSALEQAAYGLALLSPLMILPSVISVGGFPPNHMRAVGMVPLVFVLVGVGWEAVTVSLKPAILRVRRAVPLHVIQKTNQWLWHTDFLQVMMPVLAILIGGVLIGRTYFEWASRADLFYDADGDLAAAARWIPQHTEPDARIYIASQHREHPTVMIANLPDVMWLGTDTLFRPAQSGMVIFPRSALPPDDWAEWLRPYAVPGIPPGPDGEAAFEAYRLTGDVPLPDMDAPPQAVQNPALALLGYRARPIFPGARGDILLAWQVDQTPQAADLSPVLQIEDDLGTVLARAEAAYIQTDRWQAGEALMQRITVRIPPGTPPGTYPVRMTWAARASEQYLPFMDGAVWAQLGRVEVLRPVSFPTADELGIDASQPAELAPGARLLDWRIDISGSLRPGEDLPLTLYWQGEGTQTNVVLEALLRAGDGSEVVLWHGQPTRGRYPVSQWRAGEIVVDHARWPLPREQAAGTYTLLLRAGENAVELGMLDIAGIARMFAAPPVDVRLDAGLGDSLLLYGYSQSGCAGENLSLQADPGCIQIELVWQARAAVDVDYTVFVHVVDSAGNIIAQRDVMPANNTYPTRLWAAGEFVVDAHRFSSLPPGTYHLRVGLYDQTTGQRLPVDASGDFIDLGVIEAGDS
jgi:hypothetical protein